MLDKHRKLQGGTDLPGMRIDEPELFVPLQHRQGAVHEAEGRTRDHEFSTIALDTPSLSVNYVEIFVHSSAYLLEEIELVRGKTYRSKDGVEC